MIGPPGLPKLGRPIFSSAATRPVRRAQYAWRWLAGLYLAGVLAHFGHHLAVDLPADGLDPTLTIALTGAPMSLVWPADLIHTLIDLG